MLGKPLYHLFEPSHKAMVKYNKKFEAIRPEPQLELKQWYSDVLITKSKFYEH